MMGRREGEQGQFFYRFHLDKVVPCVPGIGPIISSAMVAATGQAMCSPRAGIFPPGSGSFPNRSHRRPHHSRQAIQAWHCYLRVLFVQAAWVVLIKPKIWERHGLKPWIEAARKRLHYNVLAIALANKLARIAWSS